MQWKNAKYYFYLRMKTGYSIEELDDELRFEKTLTLKYSEVAPFVFNRLGKPGFVTLISWITIAASAFLSVWLWPGLRHHVADPHILKGLAIGLVLLPVILIPVHEALHIIPYRVAGARDIRLGSDIKQGIIYVTAHRYVTSGTLFSTVALTPLIILTAAAVFLIPVVQPWWQWVISLILFIHSTMCLGDAILTDYTTSLGRKNVFTWDDADKGESYFYVRHDTTDTL